MSTIIVAFGAERVTSMMKEPWRGMHSMLRDALAGEPHSFTFGLVLCGVVMMGPKSPYATSAYGAPAAPQKGAADAEVSKSLQEVERAWISAESNHDAPKFEALVADAFLARRRVTWSTQAG